MSGMTRLGTSPKLEHVSRLEQVFVKSHSSGGPPDLVSGEMNVSGALGDVAAEGPNDGM
jgi:hypothetical protein